LDLRKDVCENTSHDCLEQRTNLGGTVLSRLEGGASSKRVLSNVSKVPRLPSARLAEEQKHFSSRLNGGRVILAPSVVEYVLWNKKGHTTGQIPRDATETLSQKKA
jgi:hypothetical protein